MDLAQDQSRPIDHLLACLQCENPWISSCELCGTDGPCQKPGRAVAEVLVDA